MAGKELFKNAAEDRRNPNGAKAQRLWSSIRAEQAVALVEVDHGLLAAAIEVTIQAGAMFTLASAQGGRGMMISVYMDRAANKVYAGSILEFEGYLWGILDYFPATHDDMVSWYALPERP